MGRHDTEHVRTRSTRRRVTVYAASQFAVLGLIAAIVRIRGFDVHPLAYGLPWLVVAASGLTVMLGASKKAKGR
ncbi:hypothetical protein [Streptomyces sp. HB2AG]|uniref:hypothetical protein n=1 Tax=Streptomyces sp. HB2AG TaxID=2983400 RepID=UPI0022AA3A4A|nr:hypothetical protein [Streptomyces sp. HB2AG]MCZ2526087.1 hypothetical protein [Streptomyces sp. HB2AG]